MIKHILLLLFIGLVFSQDITIAVLEFEGKGVSQDETSTLTDRFRNEMFSTGTYIVLERGKMDDVLKEQGFQQTGCVTSECAVEVGNMLGVQQMIGGSIGKVGGIYTVSARVIDVQTGEVVKSANYDHFGDIGQLLIKGMKEVVNQLTIVDKVKSSFEEIKGSIVVGDKYPSGTAVKLFIKSYPSKKWTPHLTGFADDNINWKVTPQEYQLIISCPGYLILKKDIEIIGNEVINISDPLESNAGVLKEIRSLKMKRIISVAIGGALLGTGGYLRSLADKQYTDYQVARSNAGELRDQIETNDSLAPVFFGASSVSLGLPLYYHSKIGKLEQMLSE